MRGVERLHGGAYRIIADRIEAATLLLAGAITGGDVRIEQLCPQHLASVGQTLRLMGFQVSAGSDWIRLRASGRPAAVEFFAQPYPGLPTDLQAQFTAVLSLAAGRSLVRDGVFPLRFAHVPQLAQIGACLTPVAGGVAIDGVRSLAGARSDRMRSAGQRRTGAGRTGRPRAHHRQRPRASGSGLRTAGRRSSRRWAPRSSASAAACLLGKRDSRSSPPTALQSE